MKKDYLKMYQEGGAMGAPAPGPEAAPAPGGAPAGGNPEEMLMAVIESQDPNLALEFCNMLAQQMSGGGEGAPAPAPAAPMGRYGMKVPKVNL